MSVRLGMPRNRLGSVETGCYDAWASDPFLGTTLRWGTSRGTLRIRFWPLGRAVKVFVSLAAAVCLIVLSAVPVAAFVNTGKHQPNTTVTYWMYTGVAADQTAYLNGKSTWNTATLIAFVSSGHVDTEEVGLTSVNNTSVTWDGLTTVFFNGATITYSTVRLNDFYTNGYTAGKRQSVAAHELGHTLGLGDVVGGAELMNGKTCGGSSTRWCSFFINAPETDDINGINAIY